MAVLFVAAWITGCGVSDPHSPRFVVAKGNGVQITRAKLDEARSQFLTQRGLNTAQVPRERLAMLDQQVLQQLVIQALLLREASRLKFPDLNERVDAEIRKITSQFKSEEAFKNQLQKAGVSMEKLKEDISKQLRIHEVMRISLPESANPSPETIEKFYTANKTSFSHPAMIRASHVLIRVPPEAAATVKIQKKKVIDAARARVAKGEDFARVAREVSEDGSAAQGGDLDFFPQGRMVPQFEKVAFGTKMGAVSPVFETPFGYHFLRVTESKPAGVFSLEEVRPRIASHLKNQQQEENTKNYLKKLEADARMVYHLAEDKTPDLNPSGPNL